MRRSAISRAGASRDYVYRVALPHGRLSMAQAGLGTMGKAKILPY
jgi:hypothetical protein